MVPWGERRRGVPVFSLVTTTVVLVVLVGCTPAVNHPPVAVADVRPTEGYAPFLAHLDAGRSHDADGDPLSYAWTFDDGGSLEGEAGEHTFAAGAHGITLTVADDRGGVGTASVAVSVAEVPEGYVMKRFDWLYAGETQFWDFIAPWSLYRTYRDRLRNSAAEAYAYGDYVEDPLDDPTIEDYAALLWERAGHDEDAFVECTLSFCQGAIRYEADPIGQEWPLYPLETLVDGTGDCEDTTILFVSLLRGRGVPASIGFVDTNDDELPDHVLALVPVTPARERALACPGVVAVGGVRYAVAETATDDILPLGCAPWDLESSDVYEIWSF